MKLFLNNGSDYGIFNLLLITSFTTLIIFYIRWRRSRKHMYELAAKIPYPQGVPILPVLGHAYLFMGNTEQTLQNAFNITKCPYPETIWLGHHLFFTIKRPEDFEIVLNSNKCLAKHSLYRFSCALTGKGLFSLSDVPLWKRHRRAIAPTFKQSIVNGFVPTFIEKCKIMFELIDAKLDNDKEDIHVSEFIEKCILDSVLETSMGVKFNCQTSDIDKIDEKISRGLDIMLMRMFNVFLHSDFIYNLTRTSREEKEIITSFNAFINKIVVERKMEYQQRKIDAIERPEADIEDVKTNKAFLDHMIKLSEEDAKFTDTELTDEVRTFVIGGADTSTTVTNFTLTCLGLYPEIQKKVYEEIVNEIGLVKDIEYSDLPNLRYLEMVIKEAMRIFPIGTYLARNIEDDIELETGTLPKGSGAVLCIFSMHRSPLYYEDPMRFIPERFTPEEIAKRHAYSYLPFSGGPRICVGVKYGWSIMKCVLASTLRKYVIETDYKSIEEIKVKQSLIIKPCSGYKLKLSKRQ